MKIKNKKNGKRIERERQVLVIKQSEKGWENRKKTTKFKQINERKYCRCRIFDDHLWMKFGIFFFGYDDEIEFHMTGFFSLKKKKYFYLKIEKKEWRSVEYLPMPMYLYLFILNFLIIIIYIECLMLLLLVFFGSFSLSLSRSRKKKFRNSHTHRIYLLK